MRRETDYGVCDHCGKVIESVADIGYLGPEDRSDTSCSPFAKFINVCWLCEYGRAPEPPK